jgi:hypothetical protein
MKPRKTEHPILFSTPMVQAILEGRKTMTRRIVKLQPLIDNPIEQIGKSNGIPAINDYGSQKVILCPYGQPGDKLWVKETFEHGCMGGFIYAADRTEKELLDYRYSGYKWKPSIFMPKAVARIWLEITDVRVERLQSISRTDGIAEGVERKFIKNYCDVLYVDYGSDLMGYYNSVDSFRTLWSKINGKENWNSNPWVWVIEFKRIEPCQ